MSSEIRLSLTAYVFSINELIFKPLLAILGNQTLRLCINFAICTYVLITYLYHYAILHDPLKKGKKRKKYVQIYDVKICLLQKNIIMERHNYL